MRNPVIEQFLEARGVPFEYVSDVPMSRFDLDLGLQNQARIGVPLDPIYVERYAKAMEQGDQFPAVVVYQHHRNVDRLVPIGGNHRLWAAKSIKKEDFDAYIVLTKDHDVIGRLTKSINLVEGKTLTAEEAMLQAMDLVHNYGATSSDAARLFMVDEGLLRRRIYRQRAEQRLLKLDKKLNPPKTTLDRLMTINNDRVFLSATQLACDARLPVGELESMLRALRHVYTEHEQLLVVEDIRKREDIAGRIMMQKTGGKGQGFYNMHMPRIQLLGVTSRLNGICEKSDDLDALIKIIKPSDIEVFKRSRKWLNALINGAEKAKAPEKIAEKPAEMVSA